MFFPYPNTNTGGQAYFAPNVYPNVPTYSSTGNHRHGNFGYTYNPFYAQFYPSANSLLPATTTTTTAHLTNSGAATTLIPTRPLMIPPLLPISQQDSSTIRPLMNENENERNKNLNIRECQSPVLDQTRRTREPFRIIDPTNTIFKSDEHSSSTSPLVSHAGKTRMFER